MGGGDDCDNVRTQAAEVKEICEEAPYFQLLENEPCVEVDVIRGDDLQWEWGLVSSASLYSIVNLVRQGIYGLL